MFSVLKEKMVGMQKHGGSMTGLLGTLISEAELVKSRGDKRSLDEIALKVCLSVVESNTECVEIFKARGDTGKALKLELENDFIRSILPPEKEKLTEGEVRALADTVIFSTIGDLVGWFAKNVESGTYDKALVAKIAKEKLA